MRRPRYVAHDQREFGALGSVCSRDIAHRHGRADGRAEAAASHSTDFPASGIEDRRAFACWRAAIRANADPPALRTIGQLTQDQLRAGKAAFRATSLADGPGEPGLDP